MKTDPPSRADGRRSWMAVGGFAVIAVSLSLLGQHPFLRELLDRIAAMGVEGMFVFVGVYCVATILLIPGSALTLGAGAVYGVVWGTVLVSFASTLGAAAAFFVGRYAARALIARKIAGNPRFVAIDQAVAREGWKIVLLTRLSPVFPFTFLNYAFGLSQVQLWPYLLFSWIGMMPGTLLYVYLGSLAKTAIGPRDRTPAEWSLLALGLLATLGVTILITRRAKRALAEKLTS